MVAVAALLDALHSIDEAAAVAMVRERFLDEPELLRARGWLRRVTKQ